MPIIITGASDDLIEIDGDIREEWGYYPPDYVEDPGCLIACSDGTLLRIRRDNGVWRIAPVSRGSAALSIEQAPEDDDDKRTDRATLDGPVTWIAKATEHALKR